MTGSVLGFMFRDVGNQGNVRISSFLSLILLS
jgi:hypothetical protein